MNPPGVPVVLQVESTKSSVSKHTAKSQAPSDKAILENVRAGDRQAFGLLIQRWQGELLRFFRLLGADYHEAEDGAQEAFLKIYSSFLRRGAAEEETLRPLLFRIARNTRIDYLRKKRRSPPVVSLEQAAGIGAKDSSEASQQGDALDMLDALRRLPEKHRVVLILNAFHGLSYQEIATTLEIPVGTVKSRVHYALHSLKETLHVKPAR